MSWASFTRQKLFDGKKSGTSAILTNMLGDTALLYTTEDEGDKKAGEMVKVVRL